LVLNTNSLSPVTSGNAKERKSRLYKYVLQDAAREIVQDERVRWCLRARRSDASAVEVWRDLVHHAPHYRGLIVCSQLWLCAPCAVKISERRRHDLQQALTAFMESGGTLALVTSTVPHGNTDRLDDLLARIARARQLARGGKIAATLRKDVGLLGTIRCLEVTHGTAHGWHPHVHELWALDRPVDSKVLESRLYERWRYAAVKAGFEEPTPEHGVDVRGGASAGEYIAKWGSLEMVKAHSKKGRGDRRTPFDLLRLYASGVERDECVALFREYAAAFAGRRQLVWSRGLKELFHVSEKSGAELNLENREVAELLGRIDPRDWVLIREAGVRGEVLEVAREGWQPVVDFIEALRQGVVLSL
jgi:hypothetical protein